MSKRIWKYPIALQDAQFIEMPKGAEILCVQMQDGNPCLWALVLPGETERRKIEIYGTGHPVSELELAYIGTYQEGPYVWHVFEELP